MKRNAETCIANVATQIRERFAEAGEVWPHAVFFVDEDDMLRYFECPPEMPKKAWRAVAKEIFEEDNASVAMMIDEAWAIIEKIDDADKITSEDISKRLAQYPGGIINAPDRVEIVIIHAEDAAGSCIGRMTIHRTEGAPAQLGELSIYRPKTSDGDYANLLPVKGTRN